MSIDPGRLLAFTDEVHLDPPPGAIVEGMVSKGLNIKITCQFVIYSLQEIQIERGSDAAGIIVGRIQDVFILLQVHTNQQRATLSGYFCKACQERHGILRVEITNT